MRFLITVFFAIMTLASCTAADAPKADFAHQVSDIASDPAITYGKLENGLRYAVRKNSLPKETASIRLYINSGSLNEADDERGLAHFLEHMAFNGSKNIPEGEMVKILERLGLAFGADTNAFTSFGETVYMLDLPNIDDETVEESFKIMRETAENLTLDTGAVDRERGVVQAEKRRLDSAAARAQLTQLEFFTSGSQIPNRLPIGTDETLKTISAAQMRKYYDAYYRPENAFVVVAGDLDPSEMIAQIKIHFGDWTGRGTAGTPLLPGTAATNPGATLVVSDPEIQPSILVAVLAPPDKRSDQADNRRDKFIERLGNSILNRRLAVIAESKDAPFLGASASSTTVLKTTDMHALGVFARPNDWASAMAAAEQELRRAIEFGFTQAELDEQLLNAGKAYEVAVDTADTRRTGALTQGILTGLINNIVIATPQSSLERYRAFEKDITIADVEAAFRAKWDGLENAQIFMQTSLEIEDAENAVRTAYNDSRSIAVSKPADIDDAPFAYTEFGAPGRIKSERYIEDLDTHLIEFENNVRLNYRYSDLEKDQIRVRMLVGDGGLSIPEKSYALRAAAGQYLNAGALVAHDNQELRRLFAGKAVSSSAGIWNSAFTFAGSTVQSDFADQMNLLTARVVAPGYREIAKTRYDQYIETWYPTLDSTAGGVASRDIPRILRSGDPRFGIPGPDDFYAITIEQARAWIDPHLQSGPIEISIIGDVEKKTVIEQVARTFGALPKRETSKPKYDRMRALKFPGAQPAPKRLYHEGDDNRALLQTYWPAPDSTDILVSRRVSVLKSILQNRLTDEIREREGEAYSPGAGKAGGRTYPGYGYVNASVGIKPGAVEKIDAVITAIAADLAAGNISDDEFDRAMQPILENLDEAMQSNGYIHGLIYTAQTDRWPIESHRSRDQQYKSMTKQDLLLLAKQIFSAKNVQRFYILPRGGKKNRMQIER